MIRSWIYTILLLLFVGCTKTDEQGELHPDGTKCALQFTAHLVSESEWGAAYTTPGDAKGDSVAMQGATPLARTAEYRTFVSDTLTTADTITVISNSEPWFGELSANTADSTATDFSGFDSPLTRGTPIESVKGLTQLRINLYNTGTADFVPANPPAAVTQVINATGTNGVFSYSPAYNWTNSTDKLTMFTYAPQPSSANGITDNKTTLTYTVPTTVANQPDLCIAPAVMSQANTDGNQHLRSLAMKHMLTAVGFAIKGYKVTISKVEVLGVANTATLDLQAGVWGAASGSVTFSPTINSTNKIENNHTQEYTDITTTTGWLMMVPQDLSASTTAKIKITFKEEGGSEQSKEVLISKTGAAANWEAGKKVVYNIRMRTAPVVATTALTILDYRAGFTTSTTVQHAAYGIDATDVITFTWGNSTFRIHQGGALLGTGTATGGAPTGWSRKSADNSNLWFYTYETNTTATDRFVDVTANGKKSVGKVFRVTQKKLDFSLTAPATLGAAAGSTQSAKYTIISGMAPGSKDVPLVWSNVPAWIDKASLPTSLKAAGGTITYKASQANPDTKERQQEMTATADGFRVAKVIVKQAPNPVAIKTDITTWYNASGYGDSKPVKVTTTNATGWTVTVTGEMQAYPTSGKSGETCTLVYMGLEGTAYMRYASATFSTTNPTGAETTVETSQKGVEYKNIITIGDLVWTTGNLVANGKNLCKIGSNVDPGLFFHFGSLVGWNGGLNDDGTGWGAPSKKAIYVAPDGYKGSTTYPAGFCSTTIPATDDPVAGVGDPCRYYLGGTWRLPTSTEYENLLSFGKKEVRTPVTGLWIGKNAGVGGPDIFLPYSGGYYIGGAFETTMEYHGFDKLSYNWTSSMGSYHPLALLGMYSDGTMRDMDRKTAVPVRCMRYPNEIPPLQLSASTMNLSCVETSNGQISYTPSYIVPSVSSNQPWCTVSTGQHGVITITAKEANGNKAASRQATVSVTSNGVTKTITVTQAKNTFGSGFTVSTEYLDIDRFAAIQGTLVVSGTPYRPTVSNVTNNVCTLINTIVINESKGEWLLIYRSDAPLYTMGTGTVSCNGATKTINYFVAK